MIDTINTVISIFYNLSSSWVEVKGESYKYGIKDNNDFNDYMICELHKMKNDDDRGDNTIHDIKRQYRGTIINIHIDRYGNYYGFISRMQGNIFVHAKDNPNIDFTKLYAKDVIYTINSDMLGREKAIIERLI